MAAQRRTLAWSELRVGLLVITSFVLLALAIFYISGESGFFTPKYTIIGYFPSANGLRKGAEVWLEGVTVGNVQRVEVSKQADPNKSIEVEMKILTTYQNIIRTDSKVGIETQGLLGNNIVEISRGSAAGQVVQDGGVLQGEQAGDIKKIITGTNDFIANLDVLSDEFKKMADRVDRGEGTFGKLMSDSAIYDNINKTIAEANLLVRDARTGNGTFGLLVHDDAVYRNANSAIDRLNKMLDYIESGNGTIGKIYKDPSLANRADALIGRFQTIADDIDQGKGTLGKLVTSDELHGQLLATMQRLNDLVESVQNGQGTAGKLIKDPTLYNSLNETASEVLKLLYDFRQNPKKYLTINFKLF
jgi:phospholipid/cholesterol/gamma-HCH transport system substrate-binding protein